MSYLIVYQDVRYVIHYARDAEDLQQETVIGEGEIHVNCPAATLSLNQIYRGIVDAAD